MGASRPRDFHATAPPAIHREKTDIIITNLSLAIMSLKRARSLSSSLSPVPVVFPAAQLPALPNSPRKAKKAKFEPSDPYPDFPLPTPADARAVHSILSEAYPGHGLPPSQPSTKNAAATCGNVPNVIESLIGTILSQNTSGSNSTRAMDNLQSTFGQNNFTAIADAPYPDVVEAIRSGGLANKKAKTIQKLLASIKDKHGDYTLQHLAETGEKMMGDDEIMQELISYDGVGPKTASCVLLFCLNRQSFAVDTHVFRLSKVLRWVPEKADRIKTQAHLEERIPGDLKYGLHVLMIRHGRSCSGCKNKSGAGAKCFLKEYVRGRTTDMKEEDQTTSEQVPEVKDEESMEMNLKEEENA